MPDSGAEFVSHWDQHTWRPGERRLHWYVLPTEWARAKALAVQSELSRPELDAVPAAWLHCTILALADSSLSTPEAQLKLFEAGRQSVMDLPSFETSGLPRVATQGVTWDMSPVEPFAELHERLLTVSSAFLRRTPEPPIRPHISLFYSNRPAPWAPTVEQTVDPRHAMEPFAVKEVLLLDVAREPGGACYHWDVIGVAPLASGA